MVEQPAVNRRVTGSSPVSGANFSGENEGSSGIRHTITKNIGILCNLLFHAPVVADDDDTVAPADQLSADRTVAGGLRRIIMHRAVAKDADVRGVEEIRDAARFCDGPLRLVGQTMEPCRQSGEETSFDVGPRISQGTQPSQMRIPITPGDTWEGPAASEVEQVLPEAVTVEVQGLVLVAKAHQAFVARSEAGGPLVGAGGIEMTALQCFDSQTGHGVGLVNQTA